MTLRTLCQKRRMYRILRIEITGEVTSSLQLAPTYEKINSIKNAYSPTWFIYLTYTLNIDKENSIYFCLIKVSEIETKFISKQIFAKLLC